MAPKFRQSAGGYMARNTDAGQTRVVGRMMFDSARARAGTKASMGAYGRAAAFEQAGGGKGIKPNAPKYAVTSATKTNSPRATKRGGAGSSAGAGGGGS